MFVKVFFVSEDAAQDSLANRLIFLLPGLNYKEEANAALGQSSRKVVSPAMEKAIIDYGDATEDEADKIKRHEYATVALSSFSPLIVEHSDLHFHDLVPGQAVWALFKGPLSVPESKTKVKWKFSNFPLHLKQVCASEPIIVEDAARPRQSPRIYHPLAVIRSAPHNKRQQSAARNGKQACQPAGD